MAPDPAPSDIPGPLAELAAAHGVATRYLDADDVPHTPPATTVRAVLEAMDVPCADDEQVAASLAAAEEAPWRRTVAPTVVVRADGDRSVTVTLPDGEGEVAVHPESGADPVVLDPTPTDERRTLDGVDRIRCTVELPDDLPLGVHRLVVTARVGDAEQRDEAHLLVVPATCPAPDDRRRWGWQVQLYAMRSRSSWGIGDLVDLAVLAREAGRTHGADFILLNPLHAATPVVPQEPSPYYPSSRRAWNPLYLRPERCDGWDVAEGEDRARHLALQRRGLDLTQTPLIDRDDVFEVKDAALRIGAAQPRGAEQQTAFETYVARGGEALDRLALAFALARAHGAEVSGWPEPLRRGDADAVDAAADELADEVDHQRWLQWQCDVQLAAAQRTATEAGMAMGLMTDSQSGSTPRGRTAGPSPAPSRRASPSARPRTPWPSGARTGGCPRCARTGWRRPGTRRSASSSARTSATPAASGSTTSWACSACSGSPRAWRRPTGPTSTPTPRRCSAAWPSRPTAPGRSSSARTSARWRRGSARRWRSGGSSARPCSGSSSRQGPRRGPTWTGPRRPGSTGSWPSRR